MHIQNALYISTFLSLSFFIADSVLAISKEQAPPKLPNALYGKWCRPDDSAKLCLSHEEYSSDGFLRVCGTFPGNPNEGFLRVVARYTFEGNNVCLETTESNTKLLPIGEKFCSRIIELNAFIFRYQVEGTTSDDTMYRLRQNTPECPKRHPK